MKGHNCVASGLLLKLTDMMKLGCFYLAEGFICGQQVFDSDWTKQTFTTRVDLHEHFFSGGYGYLWKIGGNGQIYRATGVFGQDTPIIPSEEIVIGYQCREGSKSKILQEKLRKEVFSII